MRRDDRKNKPQLPRPAAWRKRVAELADVLGWKERELWDFFEDFSCLLEYEQKMDRKASEYGGWRLLRGMFDKQGQGQPD